MASSQSIRYSLVYLGGRTIPQQPGRQKAQMLHQQENRTTVRKLNHLHLINMHRKQQQPRQQFLSPSLRT